MPITHHQEAARLYAPRRRRPCRDSRGLRAGDGTIAILILISLAGCASYQVGNQSLYRPDIQTVHVPVFESNSLRRGLAEQLTETVVKSIEQRTPYKVVCEADADSILSGIVLSERKTVLAEDVNDVPRNIGADLVVEVRWQSRAGDLLHDPIALPLPPTLQINQTANLVPEGGQSIVTAHQYAISQLAEQIVAQLEYRW